MRSPTNRVESAICGGISSGERGFTLLEVLVAMFVLGTAISSLFVLISRSLNNEVRAESANRALMLGQSKLNEILISHQSSADPSGSYLEPGNSISGQWDEFTRWEATANVASTVGREIMRPVIPVQIVFTVYWKGDLRAREKSLLLETTQLWAMPAPSSGGTGQ